MKTFSGTSRLSWLLATMSLLFFIFIGEAAPKFKEIYRSLEIELSLLRRLVLGINPSRGALAGILSACFIVLKDRLFTHRASRRLNVALLLLIIVAGSTFFIVLFIPPGGLCSLE
ncbi:hypothetical protein ACFL2W_00925 [Candidatus Omnitrophota bacterium]